MSTEPGAHKRVLLVTPTFLPAVGGAEIGIDRIARELPELGAQMTVLTPRRGDPGESLPYPVRRYREVTLGWLARVLPARVPPVSLALFAVLPRVLLRLRPHAVVVVYGAHSGPAAWFWTRLARVPLTLYAIGRDVPGLQSAKSYPRMTRWAARRADHVAAIGQWVADQLHELAGVDVAAIPFGTDAQELPPLAPSPPRPLELVAVQRLSKDKGVEVLVEAVALARERGADVRLTIAGGGPEHSRLAGEIASHGLDGDVVLTGRLPEPELRDLTAQRHAFAFHSRSETFGVALLDALARGRPVIAADNTAIPDLVHDDTGYLAATDSAESFADAICRMIDEWPAACERAARAGAAARELTWSRTAERLLSLAVSGRG